ncbi:hypothetical protein LG52_1270 [Geobacillus kaustophilus]|uniref:Uncharacterized protein n=1 Tax=Geobacillus kaustophilus TaxID=1462 RepID=A0A0D8BRR0_GEOKU|nr:hypothetical protein LG52_1270 [Geobacillus kaustophilus]
MGIMVSIQKDENISIGKEAGVFPPQGLHHVWSPFSPCSQR